MNVAQGRVLQWLRVGVFLREEKTVVHWPEMSLLEAGLIFALHP